MRLHMPSLASLMLAKDPKMWIFWPAITILVLVAFSMAYLVFPSWPAILPMNLEQRSIIYESSPPPMLCCDGKKFSLSPQLLRGPPCSDTGTVCQVCHLAVTSRGQVNWISWDPAVDGLKIGKPDALHRRFESWEKPDSHARSTHRWRQRYNIHVSKLITFIIITF